MILTHLQRKLATALPSKAIFPISRLLTRAELVNQIDWDRQAGKLFVIVDPLDPDGLLYLTEKEYKHESLIAISNDLSLEVLARPGSKRPQPTEFLSPDRSQNSPHATLLSSTLVMLKNTRLRALFPKIDEEGMVSLNDGNTIDLFIG
jgi:hypothetical protein